MNAPYVVPVSPGYVALYDVDSRVYQRLPVVAVGVGEDARALVLNPAGRLVDVRHDSLPGKFIQVAPADWSREDEAKLRDDIAQLEYAREVDRLRAAERGNR